jgi:hypothetical protein
MKHLFLLVPLVHRSTLSAASVCSSSAYGRRATSSTSSARPRCRVRVMRSSLFVRASRCRQATRPFPRVPRSRSWVRLDPSGDGT